MPVVSVEPPGDVDLDPGLIPRNPVVLGDDDMDHIGLETGETVVGRGRQPGKRRFRPTVQDCDPAPLAACEGTPVQDDGLLPVRRPSPTCHREADMVPVPPDPAELRAGDDPLLIVGQGVETVDILRAGAAWHAATMLDAPAGRVCHPQGRTELPAVDNASRCHAWQLVGGIAG